MDKRRPVAPVTRRGFLRALAVGVAGAALAQAVPDVARTYFLPPPGGWTRSATGLLSLPELTAAQWTALTKANRDLFNPDSRIAIRFVKQWNVQEITRYDILYGWAALAPDLAVPILGG